MQNWGGFKEAQTPCPLNVTNELSCLDFVAKLLMFLYDHFLAQITVQSSYIGQISTLYFLYMT